LIDKIIAALSSQFTNTAISHKFKGSKLVLQSEFGTFAKKVGASFKIESLKWKDENGFTEVYIPSTIAETLNLKPGDIIGDTRKFKAMAFRLPSTGLHSAIALKVKGIYPVPKGSKGNIVIAPHRIV
jgi:hypothetical protein